MRNGNPFLGDTKQNVLELSAIQLAGWFTLPVIATSVLLLQENSFFGSTMAIIVGNIVLWFLRLGLVLMSYQHRQSTLDITKDYLGEMGTYFVAPVMLISTAVWFLAQTTASGDVLAHLVPASDNVDRFAQISILLGLCSAFFCMNGIVWLRRLSVTVLPLLLLAFLVILFTMPGGKENTNPTSLAGITLVVATSLGTSVDLPTFFRHSASLKTSITSLTVIQIASVVLGILGLYVGSILTAHFTLYDGVAFTSGLLTSALVVFLFFSTICTNVANIYSASVAWELLAPRALVGRKEYLILGLALTTLFILAARLFSLEFPLHATDNALVNLAIILVAAYVIRKKSHQIPKSFEQTTYLIAWVLATLANAYQIKESVGSPFGTSLVIIFGSLVLSFGCRKLFRK